MGAAVLTKSSHCTASHRAVLKVTNSMAVLLCSLCVWGLGLSAVGATLHVLIFVARYFVVRTTPRGQLFMLVVHARECESRVHLLFID